MSVRDIKAIEIFIANFAEVHALPLPGRMPNHKDKALLLPSDISKSEVYRQYKQACASDTGELSHKPVSWAKFHSACLDQCYSPHRYYKTLIRLVY